MDTKMPTVGSKSNHHHHVSRGSSPDVFDAVSCLLGKARTADGSASFKFAFDFGAVKDAGMKALSVAVN